MSFTVYPDFEPSPYDDFKADGIKKYSGFADTSTAQKRKDPPNLKGYPDFKTPVNEFQFGGFYSITAEERKKLKEEIKIIKATRKANGGLGGKYTLMVNDKKIIDARPIDTNKVMRNTIKEVKKYYKAANIPDSELSDDEDLSQYEIDPDKNLKDSLLALYNKYFNKNQDSSIKDEGVLGMGHTPSASNDNKPKENKPQTAKWNAIGITFAVVGASLITWGVISYFKTKKKKKTAAGAAT